MTFTFENEVDEVVSFLDIKVYRCENSLVFTLLHRCFTLFTNFDNFYKEVEKLKEILRKNSYPSSVIDSCIYKFLNKVLVTAKVVHTVPKRDIFITLPYLGFFSISVYIIHRY